MTSPNIGPLMQRFGKHGLPVYQEALQQEHPKILGHPGVWLLTFSPDPHQDQWHLCANFKAADLSTPFRASVSLAGSALDGMLYSNVYRYQSLISNPYGELHFWVETMLRDIVRCVTDSMLKAITDGTGITYADHTKFHNQLIAGLPRTTNKKETTPMANNIPDTTEQGDFVLVTIAIPRANVPLIRGAQAIPVDSIPSDVAMALTATIRLVQAELPEVIELVAGMRYEYENSMHEYEITQVGETEVVLRRRQANSAGKRGSRLVETRAKVEHDLRSGRAAVVVDEVTA